MATTPAKAAAAPAEVEAPPKSKKKLFIIIGLILVLLIGGSVGAWLMLRHPAGGKAVEKETAKPPVFLPLDSFTVNLQQEGDANYLQVAMTIKVPDEKQVDLFKMYMPEVRSRLLLLLSTKKASELESAEGKDKLVHEIMTVLQKPFTPQEEKPVVTGVFFTSFVIQ